MDRAWNQFGEILEANRRLLQAQYVERFSKNLYKKRIVKLSDERFLQGTFAIHRRVILNNKLSVSQFISDSRLSNAVISAEYTKATRPNGPVTSFAKDQSILDDKVIGGIADGTFAAAPKFDQIAVDADISVDQFKQTFVSGPNITLGGINKHTIHLTDFGASKTVKLESTKFGAGLDIGSVHIDLKKNPVTGKIDPIKIPGTKKNDPKKLGPIVGTKPIGPKGPIGTKPIDPTGPIVGTKPIDPKGPITSPGPKDPIKPGFDPIGGPAIPDIDLGGVTIKPTINVIFTNGKPVIQTGVKDPLSISFDKLGKGVFELTQSVFTNYLDESNWSLQASKPVLSIKSVSKELRVQIDPEITYTARILNRLTFGDKLNALKPKKIKPIMVAPEFCDAMYRELVKISSELFLPNLNLISNNTISVLETNPEFIESYMVGLNHEFSRELQWREYLTDQRGSYFRQFWDTYSKSNDENQDEAIFEEAKKDIKAIHTWGKGRLGNNQPPTQASGDKTVLVIRGDLLKKYPNTIIFMQEAEFENPSNPDLSKPRALKDNGKIITPSFEAKIDPDIYFIGFDIDVVEARGDKAAKKPGYFFVLQERTGEIHFGMDTELTKSTIVPENQIISQVFSNGITLATPSVLMQRIQGTLAADTSWNDLAWEDIPGNSNHIDLDNAPSNPLREGLSWGEDSASMASILYQNPFMMAIHASEMISEEAN